MGILKELINNLTPDSVKKLAYELSTDGDNSEIYKKYLSLRDDFKRNKHIKHQSLLGLWFEYIYLLLDYLEKEEFTYNSKEEMIYQNLTSKISAFKKNSKKSTYDISDKNELVVIYRDFYMLISAYVANNHISHLKLNFDYDDLKKIVETRNFKGYLNRRILTDSFEEIEVPSFHGDYKQKYNILIEYGTYFSILLHLVRNDIMYFAEEINKANIRVWNDLNAIPSLPENDRINLSNEELLNSLRKREKKKTEYER